MGERKTIKVIDTWLICLWPDGSWCDWDKRHEHSTRIDPYEVRRVLECDERHEPTNTEAV